MAEYKVIVADRIAIVVAILVVLTITFWIGRFTEYNRNTNFLINGQKIVSIESETY